MCAARIWRGIPCRGRQNGIIRGSFLHQATWYREHAALEAKLSRLGLLISQGTPVCRTLVLHPVESLWYQIHPGWVNGLDAAEPAMKRLERQFRQLFHWLMQTQTDFDYGDEGFWPHMPQSMPRSPLRSALGRCATDGS